MASRFADRVQETTATTGTGTYALGGAVVGYQAFSAVLANLDTCFYGITNGTDWEVGYGTWGTGNNLVRTNVLASSNAGSAVSWTAGSKNIWIDVPSRQFKFPRRIITGTSLAVAPTDGTLVLALPSPTPFTFTLYTNPILGDKQSFKDGNGSCDGTNSITIDGNGNNIDGSPTLVLTFNRQGATVEWDGSQWEQIA